MVRLILINSVLLFTLVITFWSFRRCAAVIHLNHGQYLNGTAAISNNSSNSGNATNDMATLSSKCESGTLSSYVKNLDLAKFAGTWYYAGLTSFGDNSDDNITDVKVEQEMFNKYSGCSKYMLDFNDTSNVNLTIDIRMREPIKDISMVPKEQKLMDNNQELVYQPIFYLNDTEKPGEAHWIAEIPSSFGTIVADYYIIDTDYTSYAVWYSCAASVSDDDDDAATATAASAQSVPAVSSTTSSGNSSSNSEPKITENWGILNRQPKPVDAEKKKSLTATALAAGAPAKRFNNTVFDMPQDLCK